MRRVLVTLPRSATSSVRSWPMFEVPRGLAAYFVTVDVIALVWTVAAVWGSQWNAHAIRTLVLVIAVALVFEELATRAARLQIRLSLDLKQDMLSVWAIAAAVAMTAGQAGLLMAGVLTYVWFRQMRPAGETLHREWFNGSTEIIGCLLAVTAADGASGAFPSWPTALNGAISIVTAIFVYSVANRAMVTVVLVSVGAPRRALLGSVDANLIELATLCLGGLAAVAIANEPWMLVLTIVPLIALQRSAVVRELETVATTDAKTGLLNAIALEHLGEREVARAERESSALAVLIIDIDRFKLVNDRHGHLVGDSVLRGVGRALTLGLREYDTVGRFGGEEFVALLPAAEEAEALMVAERLRAQVDNLALADLDSRVDVDTEDQLSVSIGVSCYGVDGIAMSELLFAADAALYRAKAAGRNRVMLADRDVDGTPRETVGA